MRKHHNKLFYGKYRYKTIFDFKWAPMLYPTTDENLQSFIDGKHKQTRYLNTKMWKTNSSVCSLAKFIKENRHNMKFRLQQTKSIFYTSKKLASELVVKYWQEWVGSETVDPKVENLGKDTVSCSRLPHGSFRYQVHFKKDTHKYLSYQEKQNLWQFLTRNTNDCLVSSRAILGFLSCKDQHCFQGYFYVRDEKMLSPVYMMAGNGIDKVIKFEKV